MKTYAAKKEEVTKKWYLIDAEDKVLGRVASQVASILKGKHKAIYTPHVDMGDNVIIINAEKVKITGAKPIKKIYYRHSGYPGGLKAIPYQEIEHMLEQVKVEMNIKKSDIVEIISGAFKREQAKVVRINKQKEEVVVELLEAAVPIPITVKMDAVKVIRRENIE